MYRKQNKKRNTSTLLPTRMNLLYKRKSIGKSEKFRRGKKEKSDDTDCFERELKNGCLRKEKLNKVHAEGKK